MNVPDVKWNQKQIKLGKMEKYVQIWKIKLELKFHCKTINGIQTRYRDNNRRGIQYLNFVNNVVHRRIVRGLVKHII